MFLYMLLIRLKSDKRSKETRFQLSQRLAIIFSFDETSRTGKPEVIPKDLCASECGYSSCSDTHAYERQ